jgi:hypothetical protein
MNNLLAAQTGRPLLRYDSTTKGRDAYIDAAKAALLKKDYTPLKTIIRDALERGKLDP